MAEPTNGTTMAVLARCSSWCGMFVPFGSVFGPLVMRLITKEDPFAHNHASSELEVQLFGMMMMMILLVLTCGLWIIPALCWIPFNFLVWGLSVSAAASGKEFEYPMVPKFLGRL